MLTSRFIVLAALCTASCSSSSEPPSTGAGDAVSPVPRTATSPDLTIAILANTSNPSGERIVSGHFATGLEGSTLSPKCTREDVEGCRVLTCPKGDAAIVPTPVDPGTVTLSSATFGMDVAMPKPDAAGFARVIQPGDFPGGETMRVVGTGSASVAPFDLSIAIPARFGNVTLGACTQSTQGAPCELSDPAPIVAWTGGGEGFVTLALTEGADIAPKVSVSCTYPANAHRGRVPAAALAKLPRKWSTMVNLTASMDSVVATEGTGAKVRLRSTRWEGKNADGTFLSAVKLPAL